MISGSVVFCVDTSCVSCTNEEVVYFFSGVSPIRITGHLSVETCWILL